MANDTRRIEPRLDIPPGRGAQRKRRAAPKASKGGRKAAPRDSRRWRFPTRLLRRGLYWSAVLGIWGGVAIACVVGFYAVQLPQMSSWAVPQRPPNARIVSIDGELVANRGATGGEAMRLDEMSPWMPAAVIAIEDRRFRSHFGVDPLGLARAVFANLFAGDVVQGGSTLTQQLAKNLFLEPERTIERKIQEAVLAVWLETRFSKDEILELYLNRVYFGSGAYGVDAAARRYFAKSARDLTLAESAMLAGLLKAPSRLSPARDPKAAEERAQVVLAAMLREGSVTEREAARALAMKADGAPRYWSGARHYVADMVMRELPDLVGKFGQDIIVDTTVDLDLQAAAEQAVRETLDAQGRSHNVAQGALVALDGTGAIRSLVGGREYAASQFNRATDAKRQPGSAFKPVVWLTALESGRTPESVRRDAPVRIGKWTPENYEGKYRGELTLREALAVSSNSIAAQLAMEAGPKNIIETARRLGIESEMQANASIALGTSEVTLEELAAAYAPFANGGYRVEPFLIRRVMSVDGTVLWERKPRSPVRAVADREVGMMNAMLEQVVATGTGRSARVPGWQVAGKTGTTQNSRDALFVGYTANLVAGVWFGNDDGEPMREVTGGTLPAQAWSQFMAAAHRGVPIAALPGNYRFETAVTPAPRPGLRRDGLPAAFNPFEGRREEMAATPVPAGEIGARDRTRPRGLIEMLFGRRDPG